MTTRTELHEQLNHAEVLTESASPEIPGVCRTCSNAMIYRRQLQTRVICRVLCEDVPEDIESCSRYERRGGMGLYDMVGIATLIEGKGPAGFRTGGA